MLRWTQRPGPDGVAAAEPLRPLQRRPVRVAPDARVGRGDPRGGPDVTPGATEGDRPDPTRPVRCGGCKGTTVLRLLERPGRPIRAADDTRPAAILPCLGAASRTEAAAGHHSTPPRPAELDQRRAPQRPPSTSASARRAHVPRSAAVPAAEVMTTVTAATLAAQSTSHANPGRDREALAQKRAPTPLRIPPRTPNVSPSASFPGVRPCSRHRSPGGVVRRGLVPFPDREGATQGSPSSPPPGPLRPPAYTRPMRRWVCIVALLAGFAAQPQPRPSQRRTPIAIERLLDEDPDRGRRAGEAVRPTIAWWRRS